MRAAVVAGPIEPVRTPDELRARGKERLTTAKAPTRFLVVDELPRNTVGKVTKLAVVALST